MSCRVAGIDENMIGSYFNDVAHGIKLFFIDLKLEMENIY